MDKVKITECPRDAMQGLDWFIPTDVKINYLNTLLKVGFDRLDFGSFVSPKAIPQLRDTAEVLGGLDLSSSTTKLLAIIANLRGGESAIQFDEVSFLGFPFSISETFQQRNTNSSIEDSFITVERLQELCTKNNKQLLIYISMAFGNPYGDPWNSEIALHWVKKMNDLGVKSIALADTVGLAAPADVKYMFNSMIPAFPKVEFGAHLHCTPDNWEQKVNAAWEAGCRRFDTAMKGYGGCPMAEDELVGNLATEKFMQFLNSIHIDSGLSEANFSSALLQASSVFKVPSAT
jgi:hydroxymethylglutaryl-CoA lyase